MRCYSLVLLFSGAFALPLPVVTYTEAPVPAPAAESNPTSTLVLATSTSNQNQNNINAHKNTAAATVAGFFDTALPSGLSDLERVPSIQAAVLKIKQQRRLRLGITLGVFGVGASLAGAVAGVLTWSSRRKNRTGCQITSRPGLMDGHEDMAGVERVCLHLAHARERKRRQNQARQHIIGLNEADERALCEMRELYIHEAPKRAAQRRQAREARKRAKREEEREVRSTRLCEVVTMWAESVESSRHDAVDRFRRPQHITSLALPPPTSYHSSGPSPWTPASVDQFRVTSAAATISSSERVFDPMAMSRVSSYVESVIDAAHPGPESVTEEDAMDAYRRAQLMVIPPLAPLPPAAIYGSRVPSPGTSVTSSDEVFVTVPASARPQGQTATRDSPAMRYARAFSHSAAHLERPSSALTR
ncbi:hypothetical protein CspeluHIS016_0201020 [Cutaneotrichosporon spelunceum]|uniref:Transmembrane protein n=1 Tax=Cutaneotrichosporon spelunceum TaxID=1672016 RepID=A0AAD3TQC3_9TREE|nr:hypothetical protein CspeluHIS016_0201020 [Cutaneotrichosporon spelunceum]